MDQQTDLKNQNLILQNRIAQLEEHSSKTIENYEKSQEDLRSRNANHLNELRQEQMRADDLDIRCQSLQTELQITRRDRFHQVNLLESQLNEAQKSLPKQDVDYLNKITFLSTQNDRLRKQVKDKVSELDILKTSMQTMEDTRNRAIDELQKVHEMKMKIMEEQVKRQATSDLQGEVNQLRSQLDMALFENDTLREKMSLIQSQTNQIGEDTRTANDDAAQYQQQYLELQHLQEEQKIFDDQQFDLIRTEVRKQTQFLHRDVDEQQREVDMQEIELRSQENEIDELRTELERSAREKKEMMQRYAQNQVQKCQVEKDALRLQAHAVEDELQRVRKQMIKERENFPNIEELKFKYEQQIADMKRQRDNWQSKYNIVQQTVDEQRLTARTTNNQVAELKLDELQAQLQYYEALVPQMDDEILQLKKQNDRLTELNTKNQLLLGQQDYDIAQLKKEIKDHEFHQDNASELTQQIDQVHRERLDFEKHHLQNIDQANEQIDELYKANEELAKRLAAKTSAIGGPADDQRVKKLNQEIEDLKAKVEELEMDIGILIDERKFLFTKEEYAKIVSQRDTWKQKFQKAGGGSSQFKPPALDRATAPPERSRSPNFGGNF